AGDHTAERLVYAETDGLPGLIVDRYGDWLILQALTLGMDRRKGLLADLLREILQPRGIYERSDVDVRAQEGLPEVTGLLRGEVPPEAVEIVEHGLRFQVDLYRGHKTGFYLDQRLNRLKVASYCAGREVLNAFSYTGAFATYALRYGARHVVNLDSSAEALRAAAVNLVLNGFSPEAADYVEGDAFRLLRTWRDEGRTFDAIILDPPKFAFSRAQLTA
ncbi:MAG: class I SAM-dependent rRNA methyltransferase, partial [Chloroflexi bacterium]|nr:class I SAM-dependent rRNA methyltransferase [Chloroflexota bacterium]